MASFQICRSIFIAFIMIAWSPSVSARLRTTADRIRIPDSSTVESAVDVQPEFRKFFKSLANSPFPDTQDLAEIKTIAESQLETEKDAFDALIESFVAIDMMSLPLSPAPSVSDYPSAVPSVSPMPSASPSAFPTAETAQPTTTKTASPTGSPATDDPNTVPLGDSTEGPTDAPTQAPTLQNCGISAADRITRILDILDANVDIQLIRDNNAPQGKATTWLLDVDEYQICPDDPKLLQRWALAVTYFSTSGDEWFQCSANPLAADDCGGDEPFVGAQRFLSSSNECEWAGISCVDGCVTEIEFEENNLRGTIPTEIGFLTDLTIWGMERGGLTSTIPTEIGLLTNLIFLDLDYNQLTGSLTSELLSLSSLTQLDINNNNMTGSIEGIGVFPDMEFLQLHDNFFTGTVPEAVGTFTNLAAFTLHETEISGTMPASVCDLLTSANKGGVLGSLIADCGGPDPDIICSDSCCTDCRST